MGGGEARPLGKVTKKAPRPTSVKNALKFDASLRA